MLYVFDYMLSFWYCQYRRYEFNKPDCRMIWNIQTTEIRKAKAAIAAEEKAIKQREASAVICLKV